MNAGARRSGLDARADSPKADRGARTEVAELPVSTASRVELIDITDAVAGVIARSGVTSGLCHLFVPHTTAGVLVNENDDPAVARDIAAALDRLIPRGAGYEHLEGNADAHIKSSIVGVSRSLWIENGRLGLGRWQGIFFCEFDGPRERRIRLKIVSDPGE
jgi:secondary thiamine-phosphate synthase enzyme